MHVRRLTASARLLSLAGAVAVFGLASLPVSAAVLDPDASVASDGSSPQSAREASPNFSPSFEGVAAALAPMSAQDMASYGARPATAEELRRFRAAKPRRGRNPTAESVIGADGRTKITNTKTFPARATVSIFFNNGFLCTGWLVNKNTVVTAGHCVADGDGTPLFDKTTYQIAAGYNQDAADPTPYGICGARRLYTNVTWLNSANDQYDYAAIKLNCNVGTRVGFYGYSKTVAATNAITIQGYPGDKTPCCTQWKMAGTVTVLQPRRVYYKIDTFGGQSGSPVWRNVNAACKTCGIAIHAYGTGGSGINATNNHGTRITAPVFNNITTWKNAP